MLKTVRGISRPAICTELPGIKGPTHMLDLGANPECTPEHLAEFALMGSILVQSVENIQNPSVGLLNIGSEEVKGNEAIKRAVEMKTGIALISRMVAGKEIDREELKAIPLSDSSIGRKFYSIRHKDKYPFKALQNLLEVMKLWSYEYHPNSE